MTGRLDAKVVFELVNLPAGARRADLLEQAQREQLSAAQLRALVSEPASRTVDTPGELLRRLRLRLSRLNRLSGAQAEEASTLLRQLSALLD